ncbi:hypothetical protein DENIS_4488 [Desulfonema ishimotonii]|uniref:Sulfurtransferase TusA family protein n=1 Tax=Desulfonema ishimotonii TaxID=45657 RepID=A0A401G2P2_9BACT|nr:hypothetical protein [Desulfonema ishimotonii]GBC63494.1 hypothetical protein DENIS_4488 [Desulfonema ishimotonii]
MTAHDKPEYSIDLSGVEISFSLLKITQIFREMRVGERLEIKGCDAETRTDIFKILPPSACRTVAGEEESPHRFLLVKAKSIKR